MDGHDLGNKAHYAMSSLQRKHSDVRLAIHSRKYYNASASSRASSVIKVNGNILARLQHRDKNISLKQNFNSVILITFHYKRLD